MFEIFWTVPKYRSTSVYTSSYIRHCTVQWERISPGTSAEYGSTVGSLRVARLEHVAHRFGSDKLYICLSNKCFKVYPVYSLCTDVRPSQDHRILRMQTVRINLALWAFFAFAFAFAPYERACRMDPHHHPRHALATHEAEKGFLTTAYCFP